MDATGLKFEITIIFNIYLIICFTICLIALSTIAYLAIAKKKTIFLISTGHILMDIIVISSYLFYMIPCSYSDSYIFPGGENGIIAQIAIFCHNWSWVSTTMFNIFMAINRFIVFCCPHFDIFSYRNTGIISVLIILLGSILAAASHYVFPCCAMFFNIHFLAHHYVIIPDVLNYSNYFVQLPLNILSSVIAALCYVSIFFHLQRASGFTSQEGSGSKQRRDVLLAAQFFAISFFHFLQWISFRVFPFFIDMTPDEFNPLYLLIGFNMNANATMNSIIYIIFNKESNFDEKPLGFIENTSAYKLCFALSTIFFQVSLAFGVGLALSWSICVIVLFAVFYLGMIKRKSPVYVISTGHIFVDIVMLSTFLFYLIPCALADAYIFPGGRHGVYGIIAAFLFEFAWLYVTLSQIFMALNRLVVVCYPGREIFSFSTVSVVTILLFPTAAFLSALASFIYPCCAIIFNHHLLSYNYELRAGFINYSNWFLNFPFNTSSSVIAFLCYSYIFLYIKKSTKFANAENETTRKRQKKREIMYSLQFCAISLFHFLEWTTFRILPSIIDMSSPNFHPAFVIVGVFVCLNSSMNSLVYLLCNEEVQNTLKLVFKKAGLKKNITQVRTFSITPNSLRS